MYTKKQPAGKINTLECFRASLKTLCTGEFIQARGSVLRLAGTGLREGRHQGASMYAPTPRGYPCGFDVRLAPFVCLFIFQ